MPRMFDMLKGRDGDDRDSGKKDKGKETPQDKAADKNADRVSIPAPEKDGPAPPKTIRFPKDILRVPPDKSGSGPASEGVAFPGKAAEGGNKKQGHETDKKPASGPVASEKMVSFITKKKTGLKDPIDNFYVSCVNVIKEFIDKIRKNEDPVPYTVRLYSMLEELFNNLVTGENVLKWIYENAGENDYYLPYHIVNVLFLSSFLGTKIGLNKSKMKDLGVACVLCDIGLDDFREITSQPRNLTREEHNTIKGHVKKSLEIAGRIKQDKPSVHDAIAKHHERSDGSGYPKGLKSDQINAYAKIIGVVDTYEALCHKRPYREGTDAHTAIKYLIDSLRNSFDYDVIKLIVDKMSMYPIGTIVRLDTEEIARVIGVTPGSPLKPVVMIIRDTYGNPIKDRKVIDLADKAAPSIIV
ncbi:MAG: HD domain-containing phosphohydrolase [Candidatus Omnitrophota bacterium]